MDSRYSTSPGSRCSEISLSLKNCQVDDLHWKDQEIIIKCLSLLYCTKLVAIVYIKTRDDSITCSYEVVLSS